MKLWRPYSVFLENCHLFCRTCAEDDQRPKDGSDPTWIKYGGDQIGWLVPAIPTDFPHGLQWNLPAEYSFWGYTSVPDEGVKWWMALHGNAKAVSP